MWNALHHLRNTLAVKCKPRGSARTVKSSALNSFNRKNIRILGPAEWDTHVPCSIIEIKLVLFSPHFYVIFEKEVSTDVLRQYLNRQFDRDNKTDGRAWIDVSRFLKFGMLFLVSCQLCFAWRYVFSQRFCQVFARMSAFPERRRKCLPRSGSWWYSRGFLSERGRKKHFPLNLKSNKKWALSRKAGGIHSF